jgi:hypothetical protein
VTGILPVALGGTGGSNAGAALANLGGQAALVSGTNIKTIGGVSLLGSGDIPAGSAYISANGNVVATSNNVNTTSGPITLTLPATPTLGNSYEFIDIANNFGVNMLTLARNGKNIMGVAENLICDVSGISLLIWFNGTEWRIS